MRIERIETYPIEVPLVDERRMVSALGRHDSSRYLLVRLMTDDGFEGAGEATVTPRWSGETADGAQVVIQQVLAPAILGCDPRDTQAIDRRMDAVCVHNWFAKAALEMACWDVAGKRAGQGVWALLGGAVRPLEFRCRFSLGAYEQARAARIARQRVDEGFTTIKIKIGTGLADDVARVGAVREAVGPAIELIVDANGGYDPATAIEAARRCADCRLVLFEQPTPPGDCLGLAEVRRAIEIPVMADESCFDLAQARELLRLGACDVISVYPGKNGGIAKSRAIAALAEAHGVACTIGSNLELDVATAAMGHLVAATPNLQVERFPGDMLGPAYHAFSIAKRPLSICGPLVRLHDGPGLGVEVDWQLVRGDR